MEDMNKTSTNQLSTKKKQVLNQAVKKAVKNYHKTLQRLAKT